MPKILDFRYCEYCVSCFCPTCVHPVDHDCPNIEDYREELAYQPDDDDWFDA